MFIVEDYTLAVILCFITMICWGSWGNTQKLAAKTWRYELYYWDYVIGMLLFSLVMGFSIGSHGEEGRPFLEDLAQGAWTSLVPVFFGGVVFNAGNILLSASVSLSGMTIAFPLGVGIALILGVIINYIGLPSGNPVLLFSGVALVMVAIIFNTIASKRTPQQPAAGSQNTKGVLLAVCAGILLSLFYRFVVIGMDVEHFHQPAASMLTPYSAVFVFSLGVFISNFVFNTLMMKFPMTGSKVSYCQYWNGDIKTHLTGIAGGAVWCLGTGLSYIASGQASPSISYALGQGAPLIAALWGVFVWKEFKGAGRSVNLLLTLMFLLFMGGLALIIAAGRG